MNFIRSLFGKRKTETNINIKPQIQTKQNESEISPKVSKTVQYLILLYIAEKYKVGETNYPGYLRYKYGIGFPNEKFQELARSGYLRPTTAVETLKHLKLTELKEIASQFELKVGGKKDELCTRISANVSENDLIGYIHDRYWIITEKGQNILEQNQYIGFYLEKHPYMLEEAGIDISTYVSLFSGNPNGSVRDILWGEFNRRSIEYFKGGGPNGNYRDYCVLRRIMALFLEEEQRYLDALQTYLTYIHYRSNYYAAISALRIYSYDRRIDNAADTLFIYAGILPFIASEIEALCNECGFESKQLYDFMIDTFYRLENKDLFSPEELAELVMCGLNGDEIGEKQVCITAMRSAAKLFSK